jgi:hypothetical protein
MNRLQTVEDALRAEYFEKLLPDMRRTLVAVDAEVRHLLLPISVALSRYEHVSIVSRLKDCDSAIDSLRRRQEARLFDPESFESYSLASLPASSSSQNIELRTHIWPFFHCLRTGSMIPFQVLHSTMTQLL